LLYKEFVNNLFNEYNGDRCLYVIELKENRRWYPAHPFVGVGAVVVRDGRLLMVRRAKEPYKGMWSIPGGGVELGETLFEAAKRETLEECSIEITVERIVDTVDEIFRDESGRVKYHFINIDVLGKYISGEAVAQSDAGDCRWVPLAEIAKQDVPSNLREMLKKNGIT
jgi:8-oxo-dGTP diphosphatase